GKDDRLTVPGLGGRFQSGHADLVREGYDVLLVAMGGIAAEAVAAADLLAADNVSAAVLVVASVSPAPVEDLAKALARFRLAFTVEAHSVAGGVGSLVAEVIAEQGIGCRLVRCGVRAAPDGLSGSAAYFHGVHGLSASALAQAVRRALDPSVGGSDRRSPRHPPTVTGAGEGFSSSAPAKPALGPRSPRPKGIAGG
ncbi:MAG TPA: transketolase C-terminal domain-containing protein, partial [Candidatus Limnocylindrales bacterium]|nr:transketolase C-terminal domain-containing protein [Candidatus Limnocylindrales bacterium]